MIEELKVKITDAVKNKKTVEKNILKLLLGEIQNLEATKNNKVDKKEIYSIIRKFIKNNNETLSIAGPIEDLEIENKILNDLLPATFTQPELSKIINSNPKLLTDILQSKNIGQAIGLAMKEISRLYTKEIQGTDLKVVIEGIKNAT
jgi:uncharacterized protein YqeY